MSMNDVVSAERVHIGFFGVRNAGKSSVVNAVTGQEMALVSDVKGTTTDPVKKAMELLPLGPVVIIDTPGIDDEGELGELRVKRARQVLNYTDVAVLVLDAQKGMSEADRGLVTLFEDKQIPYAVVYNKADLVDGDEDAASAAKTEAVGLSGREIKRPDENPLENNTIFVSAKTGQNIYELKELIARLVKQEENRKRIVADLLSPNDVVVLVVPIDSAAPKGRLILPQQQTIRDILEAGAAAVVTRESELKETLASLQKKPRLVITDSQAFGKVSKDTPQDILLTSFSILFVRYKGDLNAAIRGAAQLDHLKNGFPEDLSKYALIVHCGGCMLNEREMQYRVRQAVDAGVPITNYGVAIAQMHGILRRSLGPFPDARKLLDI